MKFKALLRATAFAAAGLAASAALAADPTLQEVYRAADAGHLKQAETMMDQVLRDHPNSAKAHFVDAEILAKDGRREAAAAELRTAERLAPGLPFAQPGAVAELKQLLEAPARATSSSASVAAAPAPAPSFPWGGLLIGVALLAALVFGVRALFHSRGAANGGSAGNYGASGFAQPVGAGSVGPLAPSGGGIGSGILGGLATGAAVGAGMIAGEALMHRVLDGGNNHSDGGHLQPLMDAAPTPDTAYDMGGKDFGVADDTSWGDDASAGGGSDDWS